VARKYSRDKRGRFAGTGSTGGRPAAKAAPRGKNLLTRDNSGRITSVGGSGATARGGRLKTGAGKKRSATIVGIKGSTAGKLKPGASRKKAKMASKIVLSKAEIQRRLDRTPQGPLSMKPSSRKVRANVEGFYQYLGAKVRSQGVNVKSSPQERDAAWAKAFKARPVYRTRHKIKPNWAAKSADVLRESTGRRYL
jgi:hypothetical protein